MYTGNAQFGPAYRYMLENDTHVPGSVDRILVEEAIKLCDETAGHLYSDYTPTKVYYSKGMRHLLEKYVTEATSDCSTDEEIIEAITRFTTSLIEKAPSDIDAMLFGGTEEEIIARGSEWCTDIARVGCAVCQVANLPSRIVHLADTEKAYHGHTIIEAFRGGLWGAVDAETNVIYRYPNGKPASVWNLMNDHQLIGLHYRDSSTYYTNAGYKTTIIINT